MLVKIKKGAVLNSDNILDIIPVTFHNADEECLDYLYTKEERAELGISGNPDSFYYHFLGSNMFEQIMRRRECGMNQNVYYTEGDKIVYYILFQTNKTFYPWLLRPEEYDELEKKLNIS